MRQLVAALSLAVSSLVTLLPSSALAEGCYICTRDSSGGCQQCSYGSSDTQAARKACEKRGCKIGGTKSCSTAANVKSCALPTQSQSTQTASLDPDLSCLPN